MANAIFTIRLVSHYDDLPEEYYHFPQTYLRVAESTVGDEIIYYEPRRSGRKATSGGLQSYFATAHVDRIDKDPDTPGHYYARVSNYLEFDTVVPFRSGDHYWESALQRDDGKTSKGAFGRAVREVPKHEFLAILQAGFARTLKIDNARERTFDEGSVVRTHSLVRRVDRDRAFGLRVRAAYKNTCAITGLSVVNGGGWTEAEAAHIRPVAQAGPDSVRNALLLSRTVHALFDRGFLTISDDYKIIAHPTLPKPMLQMVRENHRLAVIPSDADRPHPSFLRWHRERVFKP